MDPASTPPSAAPRGRGTLLSWGLLLVVLALAGTGGFLLLQEPGLRRVRVDPAALGISLVERGPFQEYLVTPGQVEPRHVAYLEAIEAGRVDSLFVEEGALVEADAPVLRLTDPELEVQVLGQETDLARRVEELRRGQLQTERDLQTSRRELAETGERLEASQRLYERYTALSDRDRAAVVPLQEYDRLRDEHEHGRSRLDQVRERHGQDSLLAAAQVAQLEAAVAVAEQSLAVVRARLEHLIVRAPVAGRLSLLDAHPGESKEKGDRLGQIDGLDGIKVHVAIDESPLSRVTRGQRGVIERDEGPVELVVRKVDPESRDGRFAVDLEPVSEAVPGLRPGQTVSLRLDLGAPEEVILLPAGTFLSATDGRWIYVLTPAGDRAVRRPIRLGRRNPRVCEVLEGLTPGERVVTSGYEGLSHDAEVLVLGE